MPKLSLAALATLAALSLTTGEAGAAARKGGHFVGGYGPHPRGGHEVGRHVARHPIRALLKRL